MANQHPTTKYVYLYVYVCKAEQSGRKGAQEGEELLEMPASYIQKTLERHQRGWRWGGLPEERQPSSCRGREGRGEGRGEREEGRAGILLIHGERPGRIDYN